MGGDPEHISFYGFDAQWISCLQEKLVMSISPKSVPRDRSHIKASLLSPSKLENQQCFNRLTGLEISCRPNISYAFL